MDPLLVIKASDGSSLILGEDPADRTRPFRLVFQHEGHGAPEPVRGRLTVLWVTINDRPHALFAGTSLDEPGVDRVLVDLPHRSQICRLHPARHGPRVWMSFPEPFQPGMVATAWWLGEDRVYRKEQTPLLEWGMRAPKPPPPPPEVNASTSPSPNEDSAGWTRYAPG
jgi:hypothetical protein